MVLANWVSDVGTFAGAADATYFSAPLSVFGAPPFQLLGISIFCLRCLVNEFFSLQAEWIRTREELVEAFLSFKNAAVSDERGR